jgi:hypothetical protein
MSDKELPPIPLRILSMPYKYGDPIPLIDFSELEKYGIGNEYKYMIATCQKHIEAQIRYCSPTHNEFKIFYYAVDWK